MYTHLQQRDSTRPPVYAGHAGADEARTARRSPASPATTPASRCCCDAADVDVVLVGDSLGMVIQGHDTTVPVTMDDIVYHCRRWRAACIGPFLIADLPFMSYPSQGQALANSVRLMQEGGAEMVKLESGVGADSRSSSSSRGHDIAVCAHLGLKPQSVHKTGGFRVQGRERRGRGAACCEDARALEAAGADIVLLECIPSALGKRDHRGAARAGHRHRRRAGYRRADPRALRRARHHHAAASRAS